MARGQAEKSEVLKKILEIFPNSFEYEKSIRIPINDVQIKVQLTCAKDNVESGSDHAIPTDNNVNVDINKNSIFQTKELVQPTEEELATVKNLMEKLNL